MKRKIIAVLLTATMCFSIAACGKDDSRRDRDDEEEEEEETQVVETEETTVATTTAETRERETVATTETSVEDNALTYNPEDVDMSFYQVNLVAPLIPGNIDFQWSCEQYVDQICSDAGIDDYWNYVHFPVFWYPEGNEPEPIPFTADYFTYIDDQFITDNPGYGDQFLYFSEDSICSNIIFQASCLNEVCVIVGTDADSLPTLTSIYESTDGSQTLDEVIASNENIIVPTFVDRQDTAHIDAELAQAIPGAQITIYNPRGYMDYSVISEYDLFDGPGTYYMRIYAKSAGDYHSTSSAPIPEGEWHAISDTPMCIVVVDPVEAGLLTSYN